MFDPTSQASSDVMANHAPTTLPQNAAWNKCTSELVAAARAHCEAVMAANFASVVARVSPAAGRSSSSMPQQVLQAKVSTGPGALSAPSAQVLHRLAALQVRRYHNPGTLRGRGYFAPEVMSCNKMQFLRCALMDVLYCFIRAFTSCIRTRAISSSTGTSPSSRPTWPTIRCCFPLSCKTSYKSLHIFYLLRQFPSHRHGS